MGRRRSGRDCASGSLPGLIGWRLGVTVVVGWGALGLVLDLDEQAADQLLEVAAVTGWEDDE